MSLLTTLPSPLPDTPSHLQRPDWPCTLMPLRCQIGHFLVFLPFFPQLTKNSSSVILQGLTQESLPLESLPAIAKIVFFSLEREEERERNIGVREKHQSVFSHMCPIQGPNLQPRHVPWPGIKPVIFHFAGCCPTNWATPIRAIAEILISHNH